MLRFTSDLHLFHENCLKFDNRPFNNIKHMHDSLVSNFNRVMSERDILYILGDIGWGNQIEIKSLLSSIRGRKIIILGNHDKKSNTAYYDLGFDAVLYNATIKLCGELITLSHCPLVGIEREYTGDFKGSREGENYFGDNWHGETRPKFAPFRLENKGQFHLHGHTHKTTKDAILGRQMDVGVPAHNYTPVTEKYISQWIAKTKGKELKDLKI